MCSWSGQLGQVISVAFYKYFSLHLQNKQCIFAEVTPFPQHTHYMHLGHCKLNHILSLK